MARLKICSISLALLSFCPLVGSPNLTRNDPYSIFSSVYPYSYLATKQIANLMNSQYSYLENRFMVSISGYRQSACRARNSERDVINIGDINGRWNMLGLFYDPKLRKVLYDALGIDTPMGTPVPGDCITLSTDPRYVDPNKEFGFYSIPINYRKYGVRFESELLLVDRCYYAIGLRARWGIADIRQTVLAFEDFTCQALGIACPAANRGIVSGTAPMPLPAVPEPITPPFVDPSLVPPCGGIAGPCNPTGQSDCVELLQPFQPCDTDTVCLSFNADCKQFVIENIMAKSQRQKIADILGLDINNFHKVGMDDLLLTLFWRHIYIINEDDEMYPRVLFMPFLEAGVGIPMSKDATIYKPFAVPIGNNQHPSVNGLAGYTINFLDTIDLTFAGGFSYFFRHDYCNFRMPTNIAESGIFPYSADVSIKPGPTWHFNFGMNAYRFLDNLSFWIEYCVVSHAQDKITVCRSHIPEGSIYDKTGFLVERTEALSKWESHVVNAAFNYDLSEYFSIGVLWQAPVKQRNVYRSGIIMGTITFVY